MKTRDVTTPFDRDPVQHRTTAAVPPRGLSRTEAAAYVGVSASKFDDLVQDGRMPSPKRIDARTVWDRRQLDLAFDALPQQAGDELWNEVTAG